MSHPFSAAWAQDFSLLLHHGIEGQSGFGSSSAGLGGAGVCQMIRVPAIVGDAQSPAHPLQPCGEFAFAAAICRLFQAVHPALEPVRAQFMVTTVYRCADLLESPALAPNEMSIAMLAYRWHKRGC
ncbi:hypothetical protein [Sandarakinorhabdus sp.]|uniref:hypothetical protein n=1 Tax=Sandarakinorhabdus sp. TaxID=1916663 RepID=UPI003F706AB3